MLFTYPEPALPSIRDVVKISRCITIVPDTSYQKRESVLVAPYHRPLTKSRSAQSPKLDQALDSILAGQGIRDIKVFGQGELADAHVAKAS
jgi:hypothetical protein